MVYTPEVSLRLSFSPLPRDVECSAVKLYCGRQLSPRGKPRRSKVFTVCAVYVCVCLMFTDTRFRATSAYNILLWLRFYSGTKKTSIREMQFSEQLLFIEKLCLFTLQLQ